MAQTSAARLLAALILPCIFAVAFGQLLPQQQQLLQQQQQQPQEQQQQPQQVTTISPNLALQTALAQISKGSEKFSLNMLRQLSEMTASDFIMSPFSVWSLLTLTAEGAAGQTKQELYDVLGLPDELHYLRDGYRRVWKALKVNTSTIELALTQVLFTDANRPVNAEFEDQLQRVYEADHLTVNFHDAGDAYWKINDYVGNKTNGKLGNVVTYDDLRQPQLLMLISAIYFRGQWTHPFNISNTREEPFYDAAGKAIANVNMMYQSGPFGYVVVNSLRSTVLEMPYGVENRLSILIVLPRKGEKLSTVMQLLQQVGIAAIRNDLHNSQLEYEDEDVEVYLPRFSIRSDFTLNSVLQAMGMATIFDSSRADLSGISSQAFLSRIIHKAQIDVNEEGTVASAVTSAAFANKNTPPRFYANRPFAYLIVEKTTNLLLFCGQVTNPAKV